MICHPYPPFVFVGSTLSLAWIYTWTYHSFYRLYCHPYRPSVCVSNLLPCLDIYVIHAPLSSLALLHLLPGCHTYILSFRLWVHYFLPVFVIHTALSSLFLMSCLDCHPYSPDVFGYYLLLYLLPRCPPNSPPLVFGTTVSISCLDISSPQPPSLSLLLSSCLDTIHTASTPLSSLGTIY